MYAYLDTAAAVVAMRDDDEHRYDGCLMFSALPGAPMLSAPTTGERLRQVVRSVSRGVWPRRRARAAGT
jgi:hypothetical protein